MSRIRISLWNSLEKVILYMLKISTKFWCRSAKFLWQQKFCSELGSGSWYYFGFQYQTYTWYIEDTHQILFVSANSFESYCVHMKSPRRTDRQTDGNFFVLVLSSNTYKTWTFVKRREFFFLFTHAITILSIFTYSVCDEKVKKKVTRIEISWEYFFRISYYFSSNINSTLDVVFQL